MSRQDDRIARQRAGAAEADRIITEAINAAWNRVEARDEDEDDE